jgi:hypothetical protein
MTIDSLRLRLKPATAAAALLAACGGGSGSSGPTEGPSARAAAAVSEDGAAKGKAARNNAYIVQLAEPPVVAYDGGIAGLAATKPAKGQKIDPNSAAVLKYKAYL